MALLGSHAKESLYVVEIVRNKKAVNCFTNPELGLGEWKLWIASVIGSLGLNPSAVMTCPRYSTSFTNMHLLASSLG